MATNQHNNWIYIQISNRIYEYIVLVMSIIDSNQFQTGYNVFANLYNKEQILHNSFNFSINQ